MNYAIDILKDELNELCQIQYSPKLSIDELTFKERRISLEKAIDELTKGQTLPIQNVVLPNDSEGTLVCENRTSIGSEDRCCYCGAKRGKPCNLTK